jgi:hypothetical protein
VGLSNARSASPQSRPKGWKRCEASACNHVWSELAHRQDGRHYLDMVGVTGSSSGSSHFECGAPRLGGPAEDGTRDRELLYKHPSGLYSDPTSKGCRAKYVDSANTFKTDPYEIGGAKLGFYNGEPLGGLCRSPQPGR